MGGVYRLLRPALFRLEPETAHALAFGAAGVAARSPALLALVARAGRLDDPRLEVRAFGLRFPSPLGLAASWFLAIMGQAAFLLVLTTPVLVILQSCGGFTLSQVALGAAAAFVATAHATGFTLFLASRMHSTGAVVIFSLALQAFAMWAAAGFEDFCGVAPVRH